MFTVLNKSTAAGPSPCNSKNTNLTVNLNYIDIILYVIKTWLAS